MLTGPSYWVQLVFYSNPENPKPGPTWPDLTHLLFLSFWMKSDPWALVLVVLESYIVIFNITKYQNLATLVEPKPYFLAPQLRYTAMRIYLWLWSSYVKKKRKKVAFTLLFNKKSLLVVFTLLFNDFFIYIILIK